MISLCRSHLLIAIFTPDYRLLIILPLFQFPNSNMFSDPSTLKLKARQAQGSHLSTYQGESIRKSICNEPKRQKHSQRIATEASECRSIGNQMKKIVQHFRAPFKSTSPNLKKIRQGGEITAKNTIATQAQKRKTNAQKVTSFNKNATETGPIISIKKTQVTIKRDKEKTQKKPSTAEFKQQKPKKLKDAKSIQKFKKQCSEGTFDSTPKILSSSDVEHLALVGQGTFGKVYRSRLRKTGQTVAVKRVFQDPKYKNRQLQIVGMLDGQFTMKVLGTYSTQQEGDQYLNIVMDYYQSDLYSCIRTKKTLSNLEIKLYAYQAFRGLLYIHSLSICHRDIKPHNLLVHAGRLVVCDFGSAKILTNQPNLPYICSRCYRAPELIFGASYYTTMIDIWSMGCVILQMIHGSPLFVGESSIDHLIEVIKVLGTPTKTQVAEMNPDYDLNDYKFPKVKKRQWKSIFPKADPLLLDLLSQIMIYPPKQRLNAAEALAHQFFDELREEKMGRALQKQMNVGLFDFSYGEIRGNQHLLPKIIPSWVKFY